MKPAGIILAAGESSRMGSDKALLPFADSNFLEHLIRLFLPRVAPLVVVLGHHADMIRGGLALRPGLAIALNRDYPLVMGIVIVYATFIVTLNLLADLAYAALDPRIRRGYE